MAALMGFCEGACECGLYNDDTYLITNTGIICIECAQNELNKLRKNALTEKEVGMVVNCVESGIMGDPKDAEEPVVDLLSKLKQPVG